MVATGEGPSFAIDLFEDQDLNIDCSGLGSRSRFAENLQLYDRHGGANVTLIQGDSTRLRHADMARYRDIPPKIVSIDGGHTVEHTISDLLFAEAVVHSAGAEVGAFYWTVLAPDIVNPGREERVSIQL